MHHLIDQIKQAQKQSKSLEPDADQRNFLNQSVMSYAESFLNALPSMPGYEQGSGKAISQIPIEEEGKAVYTDST
jgi:hypothetical protein